MNILLKGYNTYYQNIAGGVQTKIRSYYENLSKKEEVIVSCFNPNQDKVVDYDILHVFKLNIEHLELMQYAKDSGLKIVMSSIIALENEIKIKSVLKLSKLLPWHSVQELGKRMLDLSDCIIAETQKEADFIHRTYGVNQSKLSVVPNGISQTLFDVDPFLAQKEFGICQPVVLLPALIDSNKNQLKVIRALKDTNIPVLLMGGVNPYDKSYYETCLKEATSNIKFTGWVQHGSPLWASCFANAKVVVLPSYREIYGNALFEGAAIGANVVVSEVLPVREWGLDNLITTISPYSVGDIREKLITAYNSSVDVKLSQLIKRNFTWDTVVDKHIDIYRKLLNA